MMRNTIRLTGLAVGALLVVTRLAAQVPTSPDSGGPPLPAPGGYAVDMPTCPAAGMVKVQGVLTDLSDTSDAGLRNRAKRRIPLGGNPLSLDLDGFRALQADITAAFGDAHEVKTSFHPNRDALVNLPARGTTVGEGDLVQVAAYLTAVRSQGPESVNCAAEDGTDIHLNVGEKNSSEWDGFVVEMIPQLARPPGWDAATLGRVHRARLQVLVVGGLTYDNEHLVNDDSTHRKPGQPSRFTLWEIHPITEFFVCAAQPCDPMKHEQWTTLTAWSQENPPSHHP